MHCREKENNENSLDWQQQKPIGRTKGNKGTEGEYRTRVKGKP
jgi:hypothetical protein